MREERREGAEPRLLGGEVIGRGVDHGAEGRLARDALGRRVPEPARLVEPFVGAVEDGGERLGRLDLGRDAEDGDDRVVAAVLEHDGRAARQLEEVEDEVERARRVAEEVGRVAEVLEQALEKLREAGPR